MSEPFPIPDQPRPVAAPERLRGGRRFEPRVVVVAVLFIARSERAAAYQNSRPISLGEYPTIGSNPGTL